MSAGTGEEAAWIEAAHALQRGRGVAAWRQIADALGEQIRTGRLVPGEQLPTEARLAEIFSVNRHTARRALATLAADGLVRAAQGRGTFVEARPLLYPVGSHTRFSENVGRAGHEASGELLSAAEAQASANLARQLGIAVGSPVIDVRTRRFVDRVPVAVGRSLLPLPRFERFAEAMRLNGSITKALAACGVDDYSRATTDISARVATAEEALLLDLAPGRVVLIAEGVNVDTAGTPVHVVSTVFTADRVQLSVAG